MGGGSHDASGIDILDSTRAGAAVIRGGTLRVVGYAVTVALSVASATLLIRHLGPTDFGRYTAVVSLVTLVGGLTEAGMTNIGLREYSVLEGATRERLMRELLGLRIVLTAAGVIAAVAFAALVRYDDVMVAGTAVAGLALVVTVTQATYGVPLQSRLRLAWVSALEVLRQLVTAVLVVVLVVAGASLLPLLAVPVVAAVAILLATIPLVRGATPLAPGFNRAEWIRLLRLTLPYAAATAVGVVYAYLAIVLLSLVSTAQETGYFGAAFRIFVVLGAIPGLLVSSAFPVLARAARDDQSRLAYALQRLYDISLILGVGLAVLTAVGADVAIRVVAGQGFDTSVRVLEIQAGAILSSYFVATWGYALLSLGRYRALLGANALALLLSAALTLALAPPYGAIGAAVATLVGETSLAAAYGVLLMLPRRDLRVSLDPLLKVGVAGASAAALMLVPSVPDPVRVAACGATYVLLLVLLRAVPDEIGEALLGSRRRRK